MARRWRRLSRTKKAARTGGSGAGAASGVTGTMTLKQVAEAYGIALPDLMARVKLPADVPTDVPLRDLKARVPGFEVTVVRDAVGAG